MNEQRIDPLVELLLELGARAKLSERTVAAQEVRIKELETQIATRKESDESEPEEKI